MSTSVETAPTLAETPTETGLPEGFPTPPPKRWILPAPSAPAEFLAHQASLPLIVAELLVARGVRTAAEAELFLAPRFDALHDPYTMLGMQTAVERIEHAIRTQEPVLIFGDYDVDGTIAVVLLKTAIEMLGGVCQFYVPHRLRDGYGMQAGQMVEMAASGARLIISVDNGIRAFAAAEEAKRLGLDLIVTDHHLPEADGIPLALAVLNPNQAGCDYPCKDLCGAGVAFKLAQALLEKRDRERARGKILPSFLKLLAIATVADSVPLVDENRVMTALGIEQLTRPSQPGLRALMELAGIQPYPHRLTTFDIGFRLAPRLNAAGRMDTARDAVDLFTTRNPVHARQLAEKLNALNAERRRSEQLALDEIEKRLRDDPSIASAGCLVMDGEGWHRGVIGILASRVVDRTGKPALVITHENGEAYGSGRSIASFHLLDAISSCSDLFTRFGGHAHAVGFSMPSAHVEELRRRLDAYAAEHLGNEVSTVELPLAAELPLDRLSPALGTWLQRLAPYGMGNPEPMFLARRVRVCAAPRIMKERHIRLRLSQGEAGTAWPAVGWNLAGKLAVLEIAENSIVDVAYKLRRYDGSVANGGELEIVDLRRAT